MPRSRAREEEGVRILAKPTVPPGGHVVEGAAEGGFCDWAFEEDEVVGDAARVGESGVGSGGEEAGNSNFVVCIAGEDGLRGVGVSGI